MFQVTPNEEMIILSVMYGLPEETFPQHFRTESIYDYLHQIPEAYPGHKSAEVRAEILGLEIGIV